MKAVKQMLSVWLAAFSISLLSGCAQGVPGQRQQENPPQPALEHEAEPEGEEPSPEVPESAEVQEEDTDSVNAPLALSLARRMCGTYSFRPEPVSPGDP